MTIAMQSAGIPIPTLSKRLFLWIKDHPDTTSLAASQAMHLSRSDVSSMCSQLVKRGMLSVRYEKRRTGASGVVRSVGLYSTAIAEYELLPFQKGPDKRKVRFDQDDVKTVKITKVEAPKVEVPKVEPVKDAEKLPKVEPKTELHWKAQIAAMPLQAAYDLYLHLQTFFGDRK